jgi:hypothetical protein
MGITVNITFSTPLSEEDDSILAGTAIWLMAVANRNGQQEQEQDEEELGEPMPAASRAGPTRPCTASARSATPVATSSALRAWRAAELTLRGDG